MQVRAIVASAEVVVEAESTSTILQVKQLLAAQLPTAPVERMRFMIYGAEVDDELPRTGGGARDGESGEHAAQQRPEELVLALAAYAERERLRKGELVLHFYPFEGVPHTAELMGAMAAGEWPTLETPNTSRAATAPSA